MKFIKAEIFDQAVEHQYEPTEKGGGLMGTPSDNEDNDDEHRPGGPEDLAETSVNHDFSLTQRSGSAGHGSDYSKVDLYEWAQKHEADPKIPLNIMPVPSDDQLVEIADHLKMQMAVTKYALGTISDSSSRSQTRPTPMRPDEQQFYDAPPRGMSDDQSSYQSEDSMGDGDIDSMTNASEPTEDTPGSSRRYTLPNRQYVPSPRQHTTPSEPSQHERPPVTAKYGHERFPHNDPQAYPYPQGFLRNHPQQNASFPEFRNQNEPAPLNSMRPPLQTPRYEDPEKLELKRQLDMIRAAEARREVEAKQKEFEMRIREETERAFKLKMEERDRQDQLLAQERGEAMERTKKEIEEVRKTAEKATRELVEKEKIAAEDRKMEEEATIRRAQLAAREQMEAERQRAEQLRRMEAEAVARAEQAVQLKIHQAEMEAKAKKATKGTFSSFWKRSDR